MNFSNLIVFYICVYIGCKMFIIYLLVELMLFRFIDKKNIKSWFFFVLDNEFLIFYNEMD